MPAELFDDRPQPVVVVVVAEMRLVSPSGRRITKQQPRRGREEHVEIGFPRIFFSNRYPYLAPLSYREHRPYIFVVLGIRGRMGISLLFNPGVEINSVTQTEPRYSAN